MKVKFESVPDKRHPVSISKYNFLIECLDEITVDFLVTKPTVKQSLDFHKNQTMERKEEPISDGVFRMTKKELKKFIAVLQLIIKS